MLLITLKNIFAENNMITCYMPICNYMRKISARHVIITNVTDLTFIKSIIIFIWNSLNPHQMFQHKVI